MLRRPRHERVGRDRRSRQGSEDANPSEAKPRPEGRAREDSAVADNRVRGIAPKVHGGRASARDCADADNGAARTLPMTEVRHANPVLVEPDHLVVAALVLAQGCDWIEQVLGVRPQPGGQHAAMGTHNALLSPVSYTHLRAHETDSYLVCRL